MFTMLKIRSLSLIIIAFLIYYIPILAQPKWQDHSVIMKQVYLNLKEIKKVSKKTIINETGVLSSENINNATVILTELLSFKNIDEKTKELLKKYIPWLKTYKSKPFTPDELKFLTQINKNIRKAKNFKEMRAIIDKGKTDKTVTNSKSLNSALQDMTFCLDENENLSGDNNLCMLPGWVRSLLIVAGSDLVGAGAGGPLGAAGASIIAAANEL